MWTARMVAKKYISLEERQFPPLLDWEISKLKKNVTLPSNWEISLQIPQYFLWTSPAIGGQLSVSSMIDYRPMFVIFTLYE